MTPKPGKRLLPSTARSIPTPRVRCGKKLSGRHGTAHPSGYMATSPLGTCWSRGRLSAVIDFGTSGVGDPSCDLAIAWTLFGEESRDAFRAALQLDDATWARGRGWTLWKGLITLAEHIDTNPLEAGRARCVIDEVLADHTYGA